MHSTRVSVVIATRNRAGELLGALERLTSLPEEPAVVVVDNASTDGTVQAVVDAHPQVEVCRLPVNLGAAARNVGVERVRTPYVAFSDDDSWWEPGALSRAGDHFDRCPRLGLLSGRILVGDAGRMDPICVVMRDSPLPPDAELPGPPILGFVACGAVVRRAAFRQVGGFERRFVIGGEEELLAIDLASAGWQLAYVEDVVARHHPSPSRDPARRRAAVTRNALWTGWLRRSQATAWRRTIAAVRTAGADPAVRDGLWQALRGLGWVLAERRPPRDDLEQRLRLLDAGR